jgi:hypothetical protein
MNIISRTSKYQASAVLMLLCAIGFAEEQPLAIIQVENNGSSSCRRAHSAGLHAKDRTFICWAGPTMMPCVKMYNHKSGTWSKTVNIHPYTRNDYHDYPVILRGADDYLHVFWTKHNGDIHHCKSPGPLEVEGEWFHQVITGVGATYPCPMASEKGDLFLFYRGRGNASAGHADYLKSPDGGQTWKKVHDAISTRYKDRLRSFYLMHVTYEPARGKTPASYQLVWSLRSGGGKTALIDVYFARFNPDTERFECVSGTDLGESISEEERNNKCRVKQTEHANWGLHSHSRDNGYPLVLFNTYEANGMKSICAKWTGNSWEETLLPFKHWWSAEIEKRGPDAFRMYTQEEHLLIWWDTMDGGTTWKKSGSQKLPVLGFSQCILIDNYHPEIKFFIKQDDQWNPKTYIGTDLILVAGEKQTRGEQSPRGDSLKAAPQE